MIINPYARQTLSPEASKQWHENRAFEKQQNRCTDFSQKRNSPRECARRVRQMARDAGRTV